jgi:hypothetical protein
MKNQNVLTWHQALEEGVNPSNYPFQLSIRVKSKIETIIY